jgi:ferric-dicitrate binding protein FerR (iron transport regulator)
MSPDATLEDASAADAWLAEDPQNRGAWNMVCALWSGLGTLADDPEAMVLRAEVAKTEQPRATEKGSSST